MAQKHLAVMPKTKKGAKAAHDEMVEMMHEKPAPKKMRKPAKKKAAKKGY